MVTYVPNWHGKRGDKQEIYCALDTESLRQKFETWWENYQVYNTVIHSCERWSDINQEYTNSDTQEAWEVWKASYEDSLRLVS